MFMREVWRRSSGAWGGLTEGRDARQGVRLEGMESRAQVDEDQLLAFVSARLLNLKWTCDGGPTRQGHKTVLSPNLLRHALSLPVTRPQTPENGSIGKTILIRIGNTRRMNLWRTSRAFAAQQLCTISGENEAVSQQICIAM